MIPKKGPHGHYGEEGYKYITEWPVDKRIYMVENYFNFIFVRHPLERLLSAYRDKVSERVSACTPSAASTPTVGLQHHCLILTCYTRMLANQTVYGTSNNDFRCNTNFSETSLFLVDPIKFKNIMLSILSILIRKAFMRF